ncbi:hypothetical protein ND748_27085, partial [Frankia sp. AiPs1]|uniref:hypothetical protein n=1 Tax=Frankia sp. AiPs1 TaxID=573493 RepID=UPI002044004E
IFDHPTPTALTHHLLHKLTPHTNSTAQESPAPGATGDTEIRRALAEIPLTRLREAGLMKPLLILLGLDDPEVEGSPHSTDSEPSEDSIDAMALDDLLQIALGAES